jgi:hypothetical protein
VPRWCFLEPAHRVGPSPRDARGTGLRVNFPGAAHDWGHVASRAKGDRAGSKEPSPPPGSFVGVPWWLPFAARRHGIEPSSARGSDSMTRRLPGSTSHGPVGVASAFCGSPCSMLACGLADRLSQISRDGLPLGWQRYSVADHGSRCAQKPPRPGWAPAAYCSTGAPAALFGAGRTTLVGLQMADGSPQVSHTATPRRLDSRACPRPPPPGRQCVSSPVRRMGVRQPLWVPWAPPGCTSPGQCA